MMILGMLFFLTNQLSDMADRRTGVTAAASLDHQNAFREHF
jgi:hypothetical protein